MFPISFLLLVIDDSEFICSTVRTILRTETLEVASAISGKQALDFLRQRTPDLILLDLVLPDIDGYALCTHLKKLLPEVPVIFLTSANDENSILQGFQAGAIDYISKPFRAAELHARVSCHLQNKVIADKLRAANEKLERTMAELRIQNMKDPLTNLFNRRYFIENMLEWKSLLTDGKAYVVMADVDDFKRVNDVYGHITGDYVLYTIADILSDCIGEKALAGRWGGDEFLLLITESSPEGIQRLAQMMISRVAQYPFCYDGRDFRCSVTAGAARFDPLLGIEQNIIRADGALYEGKSRGKNSFVFRE